MGLQERALQDALAEAVVRRPPSPAPPWLAGVRFDSKEEEEEEEGSDAQYDAVQLRLEVRGGCESVRRWLRGERG
jgi:hypothetical protein